MKVDELFYLYQGNGFELINMTEDSSSGINFVSRTSENNGVVSQVKGIAQKPFSAGLLTVALGGSVLSSFVQNQPFYTGFHVMVLEPKIPMSLEEKLFYCHAIKTNAYRYQYGRQANKTLKDLELPSFPKWFKKYKINFSKIKTTRKDNNYSLNQKVWRYFNLTELFSITGTKTTPLVVLHGKSKGKYPYVTTKATNNGVEAFFDYYTEEGNVLTVDSAVAGYCSYHELPFSASDHVEKLTPLFLCNKYIGLFITTVINQEMYRYSYGRKCSHIQLRSVKIKLPAYRVSGHYKPDFQFMEDYIKNLPNGDLI